MYSPAFRICTSKLPIETIAPRSRPGSPVHVLRAAFELYLEPGEVFRVPVGVGTHLPAGIWAEVRALADGPTVLPAVVPPGPTGELRPAVRNDGEEIIHVDVGDPVAALVIHGRARPSRRAA